MEISFISSLTPEDETRLAAAFAGAMAGFLDLLPVAYSLRIRTAGGQTFDRSGSPRAPIDDPHREPAAAVASNVRTLDKVASPDPLKLLFPRPSR